MQLLAYVKGFLDEKIPSYINGHISTFEYYGGLPKYVVPDNTKCATIKNYKHDVILNRDMPLAIQITNIVSSNSIESKPIFSFNVSDTVIGEFGYAVYID